MKLLCSCLFQGISWLSVSPHILHNSLTLFNFLLYWYVFYEGLFPGNAWVFSSLLHKEHSGWLAPSPYSFILLKPVVNSCLAPSWTLIMKQWAIQQPAALTLWASWGAVMLEHYKLLLPESPQLYMVGTSQSLAILKNTLRWPYTAPICS